MKRLMNVMALSTAGLFLAALVFSSCKKISEDYQPTPVAGVMAFNLAPDKNAVGFSLSGNNLANANLDYTNYTGAYLPVYTGSREVRSFDYNSGATLAIANANFADSIYYSVFLLGANGNYRNVIVKDELQPLTAATGKTWVRYINAIPDSVSAPLITIGTGENAINETAAYASVSAFKQISAGQVNTAVNNGGNVSASRTITLEENKVYTVLFTGLPNQADPSKAVQVKFIQNGTVTP